MGGGTNWNTLRFFWGREQSRNLAIVRHSRTVTVGQAPSKLRENPLVHWAKPVESMIFVGIRVKGYFSMNCSPVLSEANPVFERGVEITPDTGSGASKEVHEMFFIQPTKVSPLP